MSPPGSTAADATPATQGLGRDQERSRVARPGASLRLVSIVALLVLGLAGLFLLGYLPRRAQRERLASDARARQEQQQGVAVVKPKRIAQRRLLELSAMLDAHEQTTVHARASGYVRRCLVDLGAHVQAGQLLAELDTPELDRELEQARARLSESDAAVSLARASRDFSSSSLQRYELLSERRLTSKLELERYQAELRVNDAKVQVAEADRLSQGASLLDSSSSRRSRASSRHSPGRSPRAPSPRDSS